MLGDDAFQSKRAGVLQKCDAVTLHLLGKLDSADRAVEKIFHEVPPNRQLGPREIVTVEVEKVEGEEDGLRRGTFAASAAERALQRSEVRPALGIENDGLTVENGCGNAEGFGGRRNRGKRMRLVVATARDCGRPSARCEWRAESHPI